MHVSQIVAADTAGLTLVEIKRSMRLLIVFIKSGSVSSSELKRQGDRDKDLPGKDMSTMTVAWSDITIGL